MASNWWCQKSSVGSFVQPKALDDLVLPGQTGRTCKISELIEETIGLCPMRKPPMLKSKAAHVFLI